MLALGFILYVVPSPIFVGAVKVLADTSASDGQKLIYLVQLLLIMLWLIELPMLILIAFPARGVVALERTNAWFAGHGRQLLVPRVRPARRLPARRRCRRTRHAMTRGGLTRAPPQPALAPRAPRLPAARRVAGG